MKVAIDTLGCKLNQAESELFARQLAEAGHKVVSSIEEADVYILNTCTVTHIADAKSRHLLRMAHRRNPTARLVAAGCYAHLAPQEIASIEGVSLVVGNEDKTRLVQKLEESGCLSPDVNAHKDSISNHERRTRSFIRIQDGCSYFCSYCIVPLARGREKSLPLGEVAEEVRERVNDGYKEVVLTGTNIGLYHHDETNLAELVARVLSDTEVVRLRLSSLQPQEISQRLIELWRDSRLCPHFHLSLQSGSNSVLQRMKRRYNVTDYQQAVLLIRSVVPQASITTDIIVGFPGENEAEFEEGYEFCREMQFARIHVFPYSRREGTTAACLPGQIADDVKKQRSQRMLALARESAINFRRRFCGAIVSVLWEKCNSNGIWTGLSDNYIKVQCRSDADLTNRLFPVKLTETKGKDGVWSVSD